ncbi:MAG: preprotein translocase subunit SecG [Planctomycetes bacterium GWF2_50_10]|nr:MAG: preprotein translocase subunit SecG [Planctomycetes bacterium GWF2_50_10]
MFLTLAKVGLVMNIVAVLFFLVAVALILIVLIQKGKGGGLSAAFGGGGQSSVFGSKTGDVLTWATIVVAGLFLLLTVLLTKFYKPAPVELPGAAPVKQQAPAEQSGTKTPAKPAPAETNAVK